MAHPLAKQLFTVLLRGTLEARFTESKVLMSLINLPKQVSRELTPTGNPTIRIQHEAFNAILLFNHRTQQLSSAILWLQPDLFQDMLGYARSQQWLPTQPIRETTELQWQHSEVGVSDKLLLTHAPTQQIEASVTFFDYPGSFDAHTVHFRQEITVVVVAGSAY